MRNVFEKTIVFGRKSSFATVVRFFNLIGSCSCFSLDLNVQINHIKESYSCKVAERQ